MSHWNVLVEIGGCCVFTQESIGNFYKPEEFILLSVIEISTNDKCSDIFYLTIPVFIYRDFLALNVYVALCYYKLDYYDVSQVSASCSYRFCYFLCLFSMLG